MSSKGLEATEEEMQEALQLEDEVGLSGEIAVEGGKRGPP
jgi:hypothetical protein